MQLLHRIALKCWYMGLVYLMAVQFIQQTLQRLADHTAFKIGISFPKSPLAQPLPTYLNLHLEVRFERRQQHEKDVQRKFKHLRNTGHTIFTQSNTQILLYSGNEDVISTKHRTRVLEDGEQKLQ